MEGGGRAGAEERMQLELQWRNAGNVERETPDTGPVWGGWCWGSPGCCSSSAGRVCYAGHCIMFSVLEHCVVCW